MNIGKKLKELRESNHCTINELSLSINITLFLGKIMKMNHP